MPANDQRSTTALRRTVAAATSFAVAVSAIAVPVWSSETGVRAVAQTEVTLGATATKDSLGGGGWLGTIRLADGDYTPKTVRSVRLNFGPNAGAGLGFYPEDTYEVRLAQGTSVLDDFGTLTGFGGSDASGNRWLDIDLPRDITIRDQQSLQIRQPGAVNRLPIRAGFTAPGPTATGYSTARFSVPTVTVTPTATVTVTPTATAATSTVTLRAPATTITPVTFTTTTSTAVAAATTLTQVARTTTTTPYVTRSVTPTVTAPPVTATRQAQAVTVTPTADTTVTPTVTAPTRTVTSTAPTVTVRAQTATVTPIVQVTNTSTVTERVTVTPSVTVSVVSEAPAVTTTAATATAAPRTATSTPTARVTPTVTGAPRTLTSTVSNTVIPVTEVTRPVTVTAAPKTKTVEVAAPDNFRWDRAKVLPGEMVVIQPSRAPGSAAEASFSAVGAEEAWVEVQEDGTVVLTPPPGTAPGVYEVRVGEATTGETDTVTVIVAPEESMALRYTIADTNAHTPAGSSRTAPAPRARVVEGGITYPDRALPRGTTFEVDVPGAAVDADGRVTFTPPADTPPGLLAVPVSVTFPDGSRSTYRAQFVVGTPLMAVRYPLAYESGVTVPAGTASAVLPVADGSFPEGTTFALRNGAQFPGWSLWLDEHTGALKVIAPAEGSADITVPVVAYFTDGSTQDLNVAVGVAKASATAVKGSLSYDIATAMRGERVTIPLNGNAERGTAFTLLEAPANAAVDAATGQLDVSVPHDALSGEPIQVAVRALYPDRSAAQIVATVNVVDQAALYPPQFEGSRVTVGGDTTLAQKLNVPAGTRFASEFAKPGWNVSVDAATGELKVRADASVPDGDQVLVPVRVTYPDGSTRVVAVPVTASQPARTTLPAAPEPDGSSISNWLPILLGALVAIGATGYAVWLNQDELRKALRIDASWS